MKMYGGRKRSCVAFLIGAVVILFLTTVCLFDELHRVNVKLETLLEAHNETRSILDEIRANNDEKDVSQANIPTEEKVAVNALKIENTSEEEKTYTEDDLEMLALAIYQEAGGDENSDETRIMVGNVVMNRVADDRYPNDIYGVLTQKRQYGRLHWTGLKWADRASKPEEQYAVARAYECAKQVLEGVKLVPDNVVYQAEFEQGKGIYAQQDGFYFCY